MAHPGTLHRYTDRLTAFQHGPTRSSPESTPPNLPLLWVGGLGDGFLTVEYPAALAASVPPSISVVEVLISSSYKGWATGSLARDAREIGKCVKFFKNQYPKAEIVLMGHSTGCQDVMEYLTGKGCREREAVQGAILQAGVSDREAFADMCEGDEDMKKRSQDVLSQAKKMVEEGRGREVLPRKGNPFAEEFGVAISAYRLVSLMGVGGDDDYFSSDLGDEVFKETFGKVPAQTRFMMVWGEKDVYVPGWVDRKALLKKWARICGGIVDEVNGGLIPGASHNLNGDPSEVVQDLLGRVTRFLEGVLENKDEASRL